MGEAEGGEVEAEFVAGTLHELLARFAAMKGCSACLAVFLALWQLMAGHAWAAGCTNVFIRSTVPGKEVTYRSSTGQIVGEAQRNGNTTTFRDSTGRIIQNASEYGNAQVFRD